MAEQERSAGHADKALAWISGRQAGGLPYNALYSDYLTNYGIEGMRRDIDVTKKPRDAQRSWKLEEAKARFSEVVRMAHSEGPQRVTVRGRDSVVIISSEELDKLTNAEPKRPLVEFMESLGIDGLNIERDPDNGRDVAL